MASDFTVPCAASNSQFPTDCGNDWDRPAEGYWCCYGTDCSGLVSRSLTVAAINLKIPIVLDGKPCCQRAVGHCRGTAESDPVNVRNLVFNGDMPAYQSIYRMGISKGDPGMEKQHGLFVHQKRIGASFS